MLQTLVNDVMSRIEAVGDSLKDHAPGYPTLSLATFALYYAPVYRMIGMLWVAIVENFEVRSSDGIIGGCCDSFAQHVSVCACSFLPLWVGGCGSA